MKSIPPGGDRRNPNRVDRRKSPPLSGHLELLSKMSGHLTVTLNIEDTIRKALELIVRFVQAEGGALFMLQPESGTLECKACVGPVDIRGITLRAGEGIVGQCVAGNSSRIVRDVQNDPDFDHSVDESSGFTTRSILCTPMTVHDEKIGAIELVNKRSEDGLFPESDLLMLQTLASAAALAIHNARMAGELVEQERVTRELELASEMQRSLLPAARKPPFPVTGTNLPAYEMSGDFFDFFEIEDGRVYFSLGDVSGKGMDAALLMSKTASLFRCLGKTLHDPAELLVTINRELCETAIHGMFVTMACGLLDPESDDILFANAGHEPALLHAGDGRFIPYPASSPPLGILPMQAGDDGLRNERFNIAGGSLYVFTDGVTEGTLEDGSRLEVDGFRKIIIAQAGSPARMRLNAVVSRLFDTGRQRHDDITLLVADSREIIARSQQVDSEGTLISRHTFPAEAGALHGAREAVVRACRSCNCPPSLAQDLVIAVGEACQNVVRHAYKGVKPGEATLEIHCKDGILEFRLLDQAPLVDGEKLKPVWPDKLEPGGLGICLIHDIMDEVEHSPGPSGKGNLLRMKKNIKRDY